MDELDMFVLKNDMIKFLDDLGKDLDADTSIVVDALLIQKCLLSLVEDEPDVAYSDSVLQIADATYRILLAVPEESVHKGTHMARQIEEFTESVRRHYDG